MVQECASALRVYSSVGRFLRFLFGWAEEEAAGLATAAAAAAGAAAPLAAASSVPVVAVPIVFAAAAFFASFAFAFCMSAIRRRCASPNP